ncbi:SHOCT domain-containing protein [Streptomyces sp. NPDC090077]|uniref:SHOCT domain-containing protein n=1 Tax=Streptomyces sp. NPDC090077 TaxID=3365938 RepID=UPI003808E1AE
MFIRPVGVTVKAANRPAGRPLLRGLLRRAAGAAEWAQAEDSGEAVVEGFGDEYGDEFGERVGGGGAEPWEEEPGPGTAAEGATQPAPAETPSAPAPGTPTAPPLPGSLVTELTQLADLTREGLLTPEEFTQAKARLLGGEGGSVGGGTGAES